MSAQLDRLAANAPVLRALQLTTLSSLAVTSGIATCLYVWVIPIIQKAPDARTKVIQFNLTIAQGLKFLLPLSRVMAASLASLTLLFSRNPNPTVAARWKYYGLALGALFPAIPYEIVAIFPINDKMEEKEKLFDRPAGADAGKGNDVDVDEMLVTWQRRHVGRIAAVSGALLVALWGLVAEQSF